MSDDFYDRAIIQTVRGEADLKWPLDPRWPATGPDGKRLSWEERCKKDKQALLWAIEEWAEKQEKIPQWAHAALRKILLDTAKGNLGKSWDGAFGEVFYDRRGLANIKLLVKRVRRRGEQIYKLWNDQGHSLGDSPNSVWSKMSGDRKQLKSDWAMYKKIMDWPERMKRK
jgi:hypothetical protein